MRAFEFVNASSLQEAAELLEQKQGAAKAIAGGTDAFGTIKDEIHPSYPELLVNLKTVPGLDYIRKDGDSLAIGSLTKLHTLETDPLIARDASRPWPTPRTPWPRRSSGTSGTIAGNICQEPRCWYYRGPGQLLRLHPQGRRQLQRPHRREPLPLHLRVGHRRGRGPAPAAARRPWRSPCTWSGCAPATWPAPPGSSWRRTPFRP